MSDRSEVAGIRSAVESLPLPELKAVWLAYYLGFTYQQVASILDIPEGHHQGPYQKGPAPIAPAARLHKRGSAGRKSRRLSPGSVPTTKGNMMQVFETVLLITVGTAALAAVIVALNFDLAATAGWRKLVEGDRERLAARAASSTNSTYSTNSTSVPQRGWSDDIRRPLESAPTWSAPSAAVPRATGDRGNAASEAERWLRAANANRLAEYQAGTYDETAAA